MLAGIAFVSGVFFLQQQSTLPATAYYYLLPVLIYISFKIYHFRITASSVADILPFVLIFTIGYLWAGLYSSVILSNQIDSALIKKDVQVDGVISSLPKTTPEYTSFIFDVENANLEVPAKQFPCKLKLSWYRYKGSVLKEGQHLSLTVRVKPIRHLSNSGGSDYSSFALQNGILATGYVREVHQKNKEVIDASYFILRTRGKIKQTILEYSRQQQIAPLLLALSIGDRGLLTNDHWSVLQKTGTSHLMAISGLHVGLISAIVFWMVSLIWRRSERLSLLLPVQKAAAICALFAALFYAALAGFSIPTQRALIMLSIILLAIVLSRKTKAISIISAALITVVVYDPLCVLSVSFWLSFCAVTIIYAYLFVHDDSLLRRSWWSSWLKVQLILSLGLLPVTAYYFNMISLVSPVANLVAIPVISFVILPVLFLALLSSVVTDSIANILFYSCEFVFDYLWMLLNWFASLSSASINSAITSEFVLTFCVLSVLFFMLPKRFPAKYILLLFYIPLAFPKTSAPLYAQVEFTVLDVGQGLSVVVQTKNHVLVFDTGVRYSDSFNMGRLVIVPYLLSKQLYSVDRLIISHGDNDHNGGTPGLLALLPVKNIISSVPEKIFHDHVEQCVAGQKWIWDGVSFEIIHPDGIVSWPKSNNNSCVLLVESLGSRFLVTGDIEKQAELNIVEKEAHFDAVDVLVVPHHGSKTSSSEAFLDWAAPKDAIFSVGWRNRYGFPKKKVLNRYISRNITSYDTAIHGAITYRTHSYGELSAPELNRLQYDRYWHYQ